MLGAQKGYLLHLSWLFERFARCFAEAGLRQPLLTRRLRLQENETLTFYTDGIVEARNGQGELFGFDRVREMSRAGSSAVQVAEEASAFGQDDDITVLTLTRLAASEPARAAAVKLTTQIATG